MLKTRRTLTISASLKSRLIVSPPLVWTGATSTGAATTGSAAATGFTVAEDSFIADGADFSVEAAGTGSEALRAPENPKKQKEAAKKIEAQEVIFMKFSCG